MEESCRAYLASRLSSIDTRSADQLEMFSKCTMKFYDTLADMSRFSHQHRVKHLRLHNFEVSQERDRLVVAWEGEGVHLGSLESLWNLFQPVFSSD